MAATPAASQPRGQPLRSPPMRASATHCLEVLPCGLSLGVPRWSADGGCVDRQATLATEAFEVLSALGDHRMIRRKRRGRNRRRAPVERLGIVGPSCFLGDDGEVVQGVGEIRVKRTQLFFLNACGASQQLISGRKVALRHGAFRLIERVLLLSHHDSGDASKCVGEQL